MAIGLARESRAALLVNGHRQSGKLQHLPTMSFFSVIIPTFNRGALLSSTLVSIFAQRLADFEIIVVDDGSTDGTKDYLASLGRKIRFFRQPTQGPGAARNLGARHATGSYLCFLDSDDL